jgi:hypothetical protein
MNININDLDGIRINKNHLKSIKHSAIKKGFDFNKLPKSLTELDIRYLEVQLIPNFLPPQLKHLSIYKFRYGQSLNMAGIFPDTLESLIIHDLFDHPM